MGRHHRLYALLAAYLGLILLSRTAPVIAVEHQLTHYSQDLLDLPLLSHWLVLVSWLGNGWTPFILAGIAILALLRSRRRDGLVLLLGLALGSILNNLLKLALHRPRPPADQFRVIFQHQNPGFPSGHVFFAVVLLGFLLSLIERPPGPGTRIAAIACWGLLLSMGLSRLYVGAHWPSDVLAGYLGGAIWLALMLRWKEMDDRGAARTG